MAIQVDPLDYLELDRLLSEEERAIRDAVRDFWCGPNGHLADLARPLAGSSDTYRHSGRGPGASVNIVTVHDGFPLHDLVTYNHKHNEANGEDNRDGENHNRGWNCGTEGETDDELVNALRERQKRNMLATLFLGLIVMTVLFAGLVWHRYAQAALAEAHAEREAARA